MGNSRHQQQLKHRPLKQGKRNTTSAGSPKINLPFVGTRFNWGTSYKPCAKKGGTGGEYQQPVYLKNEKPWKEKRKKLPKRLHFWEGLPCGWFFWRVFENLV